MDISLKNYSIKQIEETIAAALSNLCGEPVSVEISSLTDTTGKFNFNWKIAIEAVIVKQEIPNPTIPF